MASAFRSRSPGEKIFHVDGRSPLYLYGYGAYGLITEPAFSSERISLLDRGFVFAIAHIRGSGDNGRRWYDDGKLLKKKEYLHRLSSPAPST